MIENLCSCILATDDLVGEFKSRIFKDYKSDYDYITIYLTDKTIEYSEKCVEHFNNMHDEMIDAICKGVIKSSTKEYELENVRDILKHFCFDVMYTLDSESDEISYIVEGVGDWGKKKTGIVIKNSSLAYVGIDYEEFI
ncbi:MAG: hypothetical protein K2K66_07375 [Ruminococcus sp.]|nr:hypothetical protein [Ruminococcus sp.]